MVCQTIEDGLFGLILLEHVQGSKCNERKKKRKGEKRKEEGKQQALTQLYQFRLQL